MTTVGQVEIDPYCRRVLAQHWPEVPRHDDVRTAGIWWNSERRPRIELVAGGPPCQGHSLAGKQQGTGDERWGWPWFRDVIDAVLPPFILIENVPNLLRTGLLDVLGDLAERGFDAWWGGVPAAAVGAPHLRRRLFLIAAHTPSLDGRAGWTWRPPCGGYDGPHESHARVVNPWDRAEWSLAHTVCGGRDGRTRHLAETHGRDEPADSGGDRLGWPTEPGVGRVAHGVPARVDRLRALGNAVVPQVAEYVGRLILAHAAAGPDAGGE
jgi:DNA (cytosine-5)-methyltransferase 1